jgi:PAS domain-containing protein
VRSKLENERLLVNLQETQSRRSDAIDRIPDGVAPFDSNERMVRCNAAFRDHFERLGGGRMRPGVTFAEWLQIVVYSKAFTIQSGQEEAQIAIVLNWYRESGAKDYVFPSGHRILSASLQAASGGGKMLALADVTVLRASQAKLTESEHRFRDYAESASDWFWEQDHRSRLTYVSRRFAEFTGCSESAALGQSYDQLPDGKSKPESAGAIRTGGRCLYPRTGRHRVGIAADKVAD